MPAIEIGIESNTDIAKRADQFDNSKINDDNNINK